MSFRRAREVKLVSWRCSGDCVATGEGEYDHAKPIRVCLRTILRILHFFGNFGGDLYPLSVAVVLVGLCCLFVRCVAPLNKHLEFSQQNSSICGFLNGGFLDARLHFLSLGLG